MFQWKKTLFEYLAPGLLVSAAYEARVSAGHFVPAIEKIAERRLGGLAGFEPLPGHPDIEFRLEGARMASLRLVGDDGCIGGYGPVLPWLHPAFRGRGIMPALHLVADDRGMRYPTENYTMAGFRTRAATHRLHVTRAILAGLDIPDDVMAGYVPDPETVVRFRSPPNPDEYRGWLLARIGKSARRAPDRAEAELPAPA